ncbi:MAG: acyl-CoA dehydrogenase family protein [Candidatus Kariarchaeaceae archaeon]
MSGIEDMDKYSKELFDHYAKKLKFSEEQIELFDDVLDTVEAILEKHKVRSQAIEWDRVGTKLVDGKVIPPPGFGEVVDEFLKENQLCHLFVPENKGGSGFTHLMTGPISEKISSYDIPLMMMTLTGLIVMEPLFRYYKQDFDPIVKRISEGHDKCYVAFTEAEAGSNLQRIKTTSELVGDEYVINGEKLFISNGGYGAIGLVLAQNIVNGKQEGTNVLLVDNLEGVTTVRLEEKIGLHASPTAQMLFEDVRVPKEYVVGEVGNGYRKVLERLMGMRVSVGFQSIATCKRAYKLSYEYAQTREQFKKPIISFDDVSRKLDAMKQQIPRIQDYAYKGAYALDRYGKGWIPSDIGAGGKNAAEKTAAKLIPSVVKDGIAHYFASACKIYTAEVTNYLLYDAVQIFGGNGYISENEVNKMSRDVRVLPIYDGTSEIHHWIINRAQKAIGLLPRFKRTYNYENETLYEKMLFLRFPGLKDKI